MAARILVADDSVTIQKVVELTFSKENFTLVQARSGEEAIRKAKEVRPDLVLLDLVMPDKNGYEVCAALRADPVLSKVPIILLTGTFDAYDKERGAKAGANDFVTKPFESQVLIGKAKQLLFAKTVDMGSAPAAPAPAKEAVRPAPAAAPAPPASRTPAPPARGVTPPPAPARVATPSPPPVAAPPLPPHAEAIRPAPASLDAGAPPKPAPPEMPRGIALPERPAPPAPSSPPSVEPIFELPPPTEEISQDRLWQALDTTPSAGAPGGPEDLGELSLEDLSTLPLPPSTELPPTGLPALDLESLDQQPAGAAEGGAPPLPESLSLEELLSPGPAVSSPLVGLEPVELEPSPDQPVFDLTAEMEAPSLPLVEVGTGEPPSLSVEDLLRPVEAAPAEPGSGGLPELDLEPLSGLEPVEAPSEGDLLSAAAPLDLETFSPTPQAEAETITAEAGLAEVSLPEVNLPVEPPPAPPLARATEAMLPAAAPVSLPGGLEGLAPEMAAMRQAVTERVAHELARDLSDKLLERIERIVWEVVPDLAEILITKEIERIRAQAEGKQSS
ncbi:MAG: response regulator [candidate division NC10 bacterium]|nr:response regulator [candidate division NC10 bacterium]